MEVIYSTLWVGGAASVVLVAADKLNLPVRPWRGNIPDSVDGAILPIGSAALGYYWYGPLGAIGGLIGAYASWYALVVAMGAMGAF
jgi:hypothetical protein